MAAFNLRVLAWVLSNQEEFNLCMELHNKWSEACGAEYYVSWNRFYQKLNDIAKSLDIPLPALITELLLLHEALV